VDQEAGSQTTDGRSVVVCAYTEQRWERLCAAVASAETQLAVNDEIVLVIDTNPDLLDRAKKHFTGATVVANDSNRGLSGARNTGVHTATQPIIVFLDDDAEALPGWLDALTAPFEDPNVVGTGGLVIPAWAHHAPPSWFPDEFNWVVGCSYRGLRKEPGPIRNPIGCNMAFRRSVVTAAGGFADALGRKGTTPVGGEETDLAIRARTDTGGVVWYSPSAAVLHHVDGERTTLSYFMRRCVAEGHSKARIANRVGTVNATASERRHLITLARGLPTRLKAALNERRVEPLTQAAVLVAGTAATGVGFVMEGITSRWMR